MPQRERYGGQQARGTVRDQEQDGIARRFLQLLQERVGGRGVHLVGAIHDHHPPPPPLAERWKKAFQLPHLVDRHLGLELLRLLVPGAADQAQPRLGQGAQAPATG